MNFLSRQSNDCWESAETLCFQTTNPSLFTPSKKPYLLSSFNHFHYVEFCIESSFNLGTLTCISTEFFNSKKSREIDVCCQNLWCTRRQIKEMRALAALFFSYWVPKGRVGGRGGARCSNSPAYYPGAHSTGKSPVW